MIIYIPQNIDPYNTHLKNLIIAYSSRGVEVRTGFEMFLEEEIPDVVHFHFLEGLLKRIDYNQQLFFERLDFYKKKNTRILLTIHDSRPHSDIRQIDFPRLYKKFTDYVDLFIHHGENSVRILHDSQPGLKTKKHIICHHGDYMNDMKEYDHSMKEARKLMKLPQDKLIIFIFGQLQFKNTLFAEKVIEVVRQKHDNAVLVMAGVFPVFRYNRLNRVYYKFNNNLLRLFHSKKIKLLNRFSQLESYLLFRASDIIFLPHNSGLTTGIIPMAATLSKPFVYPGIGVFEEQAEFCLAEKYECNDILSASSAIERILLSDAKSFDNKQWLKNNNWYDHACKILASI